MLPSTFRQIEVFVAVVEAGSFSAAGERLSIATSSISNHIRSLERHMGCPLFDRRRGGQASLTEAGRRLYQRSLAVLEQLEQLNRELSANRPAPARRRLVIAAQRLLATSRLAAPLADYTASHDDADIVVESGSTEDVLEHVRQGRVAIGYLMQFGPLGDYPSTIIGQEPVGLFAAPDHPLAGRTAIPVAEIARQTFVATRQDRRFGQMINSVLFAAGITNVPLAAQMQDGSLLTELVYRGVGILCAVERPLAPLLAAGRLCRLDVASPPWQVDIHQIFPPGRKPDRLALDFARFVAGRI